MVDVLRPLISRPGVYRAPAGVGETTPGSGIYLLDGVESPVGSGIYAFTEGPSFEVVTSSNPPSARLTFDADDLPDATHTIVVTRSYDGVSETVRDAWNRFAAGGAVLTDPEIPTGVPVTYQAQAFDTAGLPLGTTGQVTVQVDSDPSKVWFSDPANPNLVLQVDAYADFGEDLIEARQVQTYQVGNRMVALLGALGKLQNLPLRVKTTTVEDGVALREILRQTSILIRTAPPVDLPRLLYVVVPEVKKTRTGSVEDIQYGGGSANWEMTAQEVSTTTLDILVPLVTWQTYIDAFPGATWADVMAVYNGTWLDAIKNPPGV